LFIYDKWKDKKKTERNISSIIQTENVNITAVKLN